MLQAIKRFFLRIIGHTLVSQALGTEHAIVKELESLAKKHEDTLGFFKKAKDDAVKTKQQIADSSLLLQSHIQQLIRQEEALSGQLNSVNKFITKMDEFI